MFDIIASIVLVVSLAILLVLFIRKQKKLSTLFNKKKQPLETDENGEEISLLESLDKKLNAFLEFFLRKLRTLLLKSDNTVSKWIHSLKKENGAQVQEMFFIEEQVIEGGTEIDTEAVIEVKKRPLKKRLKKKNSER